MGNRHDGKVLPRGTPPCESGQPRGGTPQDDRVSPVANHPVKEASLVAAHYKIIDERLVAHHKMIEERLVAHKKGAVSK